MPRALTEQEKEGQRRWLLEKGKSIVMGYGVRKVSIDDIARAAGMAKGTFYQHFESKEQYLGVLIAMLHQDLFTKAEQIIPEGLTGEGRLPENSGLQRNARSFLEELFFMPEIAFFIQNEHEIDLLFRNLSEWELDSFKKLEVAMFEGILSMAGIDTAKVRPGVVHNYIHILFLVKSSDYMTEADLQETMDLIMNSLLLYVFGKQV